MSFLASGLVTGAFFALVLVMAFRPGWLSASITSGRVDSPGLVAALGFILVTLAVMVGFARWRGAGRDD